jgi:hypothetical protein
MFCSSWNFFFCVHEWALLLRLVLGVVCGRPLLSCLITDGGGAVVDAPPPAVARGVSEGLHSCTGWRLASGTDSGSLITWSVKFRVLMSDPE